MYGEGVRMQRWRYAARFVVRKVMTLSARCRERVVSIAKTHEHFFFLSVLLISYISRQHIADCVVLASSFDNDFCHLVRSRFCYLETLVMSSPAITGSFGATLLKTWMDA